MSIVGKLLLSIVTALAYISKLITSKSTNYFVQCKEVLIIAKNNVHVYIFIECKLLHSLNVLNPLIEPILNIFTMSRGEVIIAELKSLRRIPETMTVKLLPHKLPHPVQTGDDK